MNDLKNTALIIVDMQNDDIHQNGFRRKYAHEFGVAAESLELLRTPIPNIQKLSERFRKNQKDVIYIYLAFEPDYSDAVPADIMTKPKEMGAMVRGSWGAQIIDELTPHKNDHMVRKHTSGGFHQTPLDRMLRNLNIKTLVITGVCTNFCVETTVREAVAYGYDVILVSDATASFDPEGHQATMKVVARGFGEVMSTEEVLKRI